MKETFNKGDKLSKKMWQDYLEHLRNQEVSGDKTSIEDAFEARFWDDYTSLINNYKIENHHRIIQTTGTSQQLLNIYSKFWRDVPPGIIHEHTQPFKSTGAGWRPVIKTVGTIVAGIILINLGFSEIVLSFGFLGLIVFLVRLGGGNKQPPQAIGEDYQTTYTLDMKPTELVFEQLDDFDNHYKYTIPYHKIKSLQLTANHLIIKPYDPATLRGQVSSLFAKKGRIPTNMPEFEHLKSFLSEVAIHNYQQKQLEDSLSD